MLPNLLPAMLHTVIQEMNLNTVKPSHTHVGQYPTRLTVTIFVEGKDYAYILYSTSLKNLQSAHAQAYFF